MAVPAALAALGKLVAWLGAAYMGYEAADTGVGIATDDEETLFSALGLTLSPKDRRKLSKTRQDVLNTEIASRDTSDEVRALTRREDRRPGRDMADLSMALGALERGFLPTDLSPDIGGELMQRLRRREREHLREAQSGPPRQERRIRAPNEVMGIQPPAPPPGPAIGMGPPAPPPAPQGMMTQGMMGPPGP